MQHFYDMQTGENTTENADAPFYPEPIEIERGNMIVSRFQGRVALGPETCAVLDAMSEDPETPWAMREAIKNTIEWRRTSQTMDELGWVLGYSPERMDELFRFAKTIDA